MQGVRSTAANCIARDIDLAEGDEIAADFKGSPAINAALVSAAQKVEHYEIASYGCLHEWAGLLGNGQAAGLLEEILGEEKAANETLSDLARSTCNQQALASNEEDDRSQATLREKTPTPVLGVGLPIRIAQANLCRTASSQ